jgi:hypothetical protein
MGYQPASRPGVQHILETTGRPVTAKFQRLDPDKFQVAKSKVLKKEQEELFITHTAVGPASYIWFTKQTVLGGHEGTTNS